MEGKHPLKTVFCNSFEIFLPETLDKRFQKSYNKGARKQQPFSCVAERPPFFSSCRACRSGSQKRVQRAFRKSCDKAPAVPPAGALFIPRGRVVVLLRGILSFCPDCGKRPAKVCGSRILQFVRECGTLFKIDPRTENEQSQKEMRYGLLFRSAQPYLW